MDDCNITILISAYEKERETVCLNCKSAFDCPATSSHRESCKYQLYVSPAIINSENYKTYKELKNEIK